MPTTFPREQDQRLRHNLAGALFGLTLGMVLSWTKYLYPLYILRDVPIQSTSYNLEPDVITQAVTITLIGALLGGFLVARLHQRVMLALVLGAIMVVIVWSVPGYLLEAARLAHQEFAELEWIRLPVGLLLGAVLSFLGGLIGAGFEYWVLSYTDQLFERPASFTPLAWALVMGAGALMGQVAGGISTRRQEEIAAALAVNAAVRMTNDQPVPAGELPANFFISDPARNTLHEFGARLQQPYRLSMSQNTGVEVITDIQFQDGLVVRCVSAAARISRCYQE